MILTYSFQDIIFELLLIFVFFYIFYIIVEAQAIINLWCVHGIFINYYKIEKN